MIKELFDKIAIKRALTRISYEIIEKNKGTENLVLFGIKTRGVYLAKRIAKRIEELEGVKIPVGVLDITLYRDDRQDVSLSNEAVVSSTECNTDVNKKNVILIDDVLYTGRTIRAAMDALIHMGRPNSISLAVLVDRGHRELPIRADYVGKNIPTALNEKVSVNVEEIDNKDSIELEKLES